MKWSLQYTSEIYWDKNPRASGRVYIKWLTSPLKPLVIYKKFIEANLSLKIIEFISLVITQRELTLEDFAWFLYYYKELSFLYTTT